MGNYATPRLTAPELTLPERREPPPRKAKTASTDGAAEGDAAADAAADAAEASATAADAAAAVDAVMKLLLAVFYHIYTETIERLSATLLPQETGAGASRGEDHDEDDDKTELLGAQVRSYSCIRYIFSTVHGYCQFGPSVCTSARPLIRW